MTEAHQHVVDAQLLLHRGGELPAASSAAIAAHVQACSLCRARLDELEKTFVQFASAHFEAADVEAVDRELPCAAGPRARLQERLAELSAQNGKGGAQGQALRGRGALPFGWAARVGSRQGALLAAVAIAACLLFAIRLYGPGEKSHSSTSSQPALASASQPRSEEPDLRLTPGATTPVTQSQVCGAEAARITAVVPVALKRKVFEEYGVAPARPDAYEVDYLITPELGGATDIRNLWPEPSQDTLWNSYVKDQLEERLHRMVCHGDVDLATAQRDISTDWIAAYRKYFHADKPVADDSSFDRQLDRTHPLT